MTKQIAMALQVYADESDGRLPLAANWCDVTRPLVRNDALYHCSAIYEKVSVTHAKQFGRALNLQLAGANVNKIEHDATFPLVFDSTNLKWNATDSLDTLAFRHNGLACLAYVDGHTKFVRPGEQ